MKEEHKEQERPIHMLMGLGLLKRIDEYRYSQHIPTRAEAIRNLIDQGLAVFERRTKKK